MKSRKQRTVKTGGSKRKVPSDVSPSTSLPPLVEGQLRCFLRVTIGRVLWTVHKPPSGMFVRLRWWGESSNGTHFFPRDGLQLSQKTIKTIARFPIRCGPKQFTSYLTDMGSLVLEVLTKPDHLPIARAQVAGISLLSLSNPISGFYTLVSPTSEKLGELQVSLNLEPLTEAYDSSSSGPTTDIRPQVTRLAMPLQPRLLSAGSEKESVGSSSGNTPRGKDHLYFQNTQKDKDNEESLENQVLVTSKSQTSKTTTNPSSHKTCEQTSNDILSVLLERGNKLRNAMVASALKCEMDSASAVKDALPSVPKNNTPPLSKSIPSPSGMFLQNILHADSSLKRSDDIAVVSDSGLDCPADMDNRAVDLLLGSLNTSPVPLWDGEVSSLESLSGHSSVYGDSELNDPQYDQSLLENLFYTTPMSDTRADETELEGQETIFLSKNKQINLTQSAPKTSGGSSSENQGSVDASRNLPGLGEEQLTLLDSVRVARVTIHSLTVPTGSTITTPRKVSNKGKPAQPLTSKKCTYFVEYMFPMAFSSSRNDHSKAGEGVVTRAVCSRVTGGVVKFHQHSVFPVRFNLATVNQLWGTDLIFKIYSRKSDQKKPVPIGKSAHPLRCLLQSKQLRQSVILPVQSLEGNSETQEIGPLKVVLELRTDSTNSEKRKSKLAWADRSLSQTAHSPERDCSSTSHQVDASKQEVPVFSLKDSRLNVWSPQKPSKEPFLPRKSWEQVEEDSKVLLHTILMVPGGKNFSCESMQTPNVYLSCKLLWCDEMVRSAVSWGQANPTFNFVQVAPVTLTTKLLERMKNNVMIIEVWLKAGNSGQDRLLGLVKLPLHQFYMSFRDPKIAHLLLQAQYPVLGVDCYMPVIDVFSGSCKGNLRVVLAMGRSEQIASFQRTRYEEYDSLSHLVRPVHLLDHQPHSETKVIEAHNEIMREHLFVIIVEKVRGLTPLQSTVWGEADCYVQYSFPCQEGVPAVNLDQNLVESSVNLKPFRTTTTLCVPDPVFGHTEAHVLLVPEGVPVQRLLLSSLSSQGLSSGGGVQFEVWCRYYYPNVRDQLVAKGLLPLSKLCAMVTMQRQQPNEAQMFSLALIPRLEIPMGHQPQSSGLLDVCIQYKHRPLKPEGQTGRGAASRIVTLIVQVHRASGLQAAARLLSKQDERFSYFAGVGVNTYVTVQLSFLSERERKCTRIAARTFCPEFDHHMEVSCDLLVQSSSGETCSLAEELEEASAVFTVWNRDNRKVNISKPKDMTLGTVKVPLADLIHKRTGITGWYGVYAPQEISSSQCQHILVGGLEISINFAHHSDRERVIKAAQDLGWEMAHNDYAMHENEECWEESSRKLSLTFSMPRAWIPIHCLLLPGNSELQRSTYCYFRYRFYDQDAFCSHMKHPRVEESGEDGQATVTFEGSRSMELRSTQPLMWYLREERLEVQVWVAFMKDKTIRPSDTDRLVGSAYVDLSSLAKMPKNKMTLSGVYPLFRRSAADLQGAALRVHIILTTGSVPREASAVFYNQGELLSEEVETVARPLSPTTPKQSCTQSTHTNTFSNTTPDITSVQHTEMSVDESFPATVSVDRAMHLNLKGCPLAEHSEASPCCCVSYVTADSAEPLSTAVVANTDCPVWDHQHECRLSKKLLVDPQQSLVFKVWHKGEMERLLGFASVDLSPLLCGFLSVCGWYNITDFNGQCHGQLKVSITPLKGVQDLREQRKSVNEEAPKHSSAFPLNYHTTATYNSFPSHISCYTEQKISSLNHLDKLFSERSTESERHLEHMDKVRLYHQSLQEQTAAHSECSSSANDLTPSSSFLFSALRKKLSELDNIQRYFSRKLSTPTFPSELDYHTTHEEQRQPETDTSQILLKSTQLVGEVNKIISGLRRSHLETIPSNPESRSLPSPEHNPQTIPEYISSPGRASTSSHTDVTPLPSPHPKSSEEQDFELENGMNQENHKVIVSEDETEEEEDENLSGCRQDEEADIDEEEDQDYDEVVVKPRHLNEVSSFTDKTSPWTSILSDPDLVSLESLKASEELGLSQDKDEKKQLVSLEALDCGGKHECPIQQESDSFNGSAGKASDTESDDERTLQAFDEKRGNGPSSSKKGSGNTGRSPIKQHATDTHDASCSLNNQDSQLQPLSSVPVEVPNFFLPSQQLEASMRAIRLAPSFSKSSNDPGQSTPFQRISHHRHTGQRPNMSPSTMKKETERIAKIFAAHFDDNH
ncbi:C2 domain-containing protein 3 isoform X2 [Mastacembelus armatus]|uniref:C2 domain-containing protein 3 isoform X2 n=1 Tax=Mastacembelus armatus TaxID=205130 RepID=UPI000E45AFAE|nr:C2 domain-containing protein 3 isoform X2 [Mastacembelus armatus]